MLKKVVIYVTKLIYDAAVQDEQNTRRAVL